MCLCALENPFAALPEWARCTVTAMYTQLLCSWSKHYRGTQKISKRRGSSYIQQPTMAARSSVSDLNIVPSVAVKYRFDATGPKVLFGESVVMGLV